MTPSAVENKRAKGHTTRNCSVIKEKRDDDLRKGSVCDHCLCSQRELLRARDDDAHGGNLTEVSASGKEKEKKGRMRTTDCDAREESVSERQ